MRRIFVFALGILALGALVAWSALAQRPRIGLPPQPLGEGPFLFDTAEQGKIRVAVVTKGLHHPWGLAFLPGGDMLVSERRGTVRLIRNGVLEPTPVAGVPPVYAQALTGLMDIALHPEFSQNRFVYLAYTKPLEKDVMTTALARARWDGAALADTHDIFVANSTGRTGAAASRLSFGPDGKIYMTIGGVFDGRAQNKDSHSGKIVRLNDDGTAPADNPFVRQTEYAPGIFSMGHRNGLGLVFHPETGELWENENGPNGGDEVNIIRAGRNYGWPLVSYGRDYGGPRISAHTWQEGIEEPILVWLPSIGVSGMTFYTGEHFPAWKGNLFAGAAQVGEIAGTGHLQRIVFTKDFGELRRESILTELHQRIRDVRQGPDGLLYLLTEEEDGALLRIEPVQ